MTDNPSIVDSIMAGLSHEYFDGNELIIRIFAEFF